MTFSSLWSLDPAITFLNHGSFGACPIAVLEVQERLRRQMEHEPLRFYNRELRPLMEAARQELATFVGADPADLVFTSNATSGVNTVLRSLRFRPNDELLTTNHTYGACRLALEFAAGQVGARVVIARVPFPLETPEQVVDAVLEQVTSRTRLALLDHVASAAGLIFPLQRLTRELTERGVEVLVDGAHAPGMIDLDLQAIGATYYAGNGHKWLCAPKGAAFLYVQRDRQREILPLTISFGAGGPPDDPDRFRHAFDWTGTQDPTPWLGMAESIRYLGSLLPGGWPELRARNHRLALEARDLLCRTLGVSPPCPDDMIGSLAAVPLPDGFPEALGEILFHDHHFEVPITGLADPPCRFLRLSAHLYNCREHYQRLAEVLTKLRH